MNSYLLIQIGIFILFVAYAFIGTRIIRRWLHAKEDRDFARFKEKHSLLPVVQYFLLDNKLGFPIGFVVVERDAVSLIHKKGPFRRVAFTDIKNVVIPSDVVYGEAVILTNEGEKITFRLNQDITDSTQPTVEERSTAVMSGLNHFYGQDAVAGAADRVAAAYQRMKVAIAPNVLVLE